MISCNGVNNTDSANSKQSNIDQYAKIQLYADLSELDENHRKIIHYLTKAAKQADAIFWKQTYGEKNELLYLYRNKPDDIKEYITINYGPWDRFNDNKPFIEGIGEKPKGSNLYPKDMTTEEFNEIKDEDKYSPFTILIRDKRGKIKTKRYYEAYKSNLDQAIHYINKAIDICDNKEFKEYLIALTEDIKKDEYTNSFIKWMNVDHYPINFIFGPVESLSNEDQLYNLKNTYASVILLPKMEWRETSKKLMQLMPYLQNSLPIEDGLKSEIPSEGTHIDVNEMIICSGKWNTGAKEISIFLPQDPNFHLNYGSKKMLFENAVSAKYNLILKPIGNKLIDKDQRDLIRYESFVENLMMSEIGNGLGIKKTKDGKSVKLALQDTYTVSEITYSLIVSQYFMAKKLEIDGADADEIMSHYVTFVTSLLRIVRYGIKNAYSVASMIVFNYLLDNEAIIYDRDKRTYYVEYDNMKLHTFKMTEYILKIHADGDYKESTKLIREKGYIHDELLIDLYYLQQENIPTDIIYDQGKLRTKI
ncbi:MAG: hypothetical protein N4A72_03465 [Bacteroidales bacterium]|jgi:hypothetical protein|nr:hypothetical protein [Bacteroidales bacterium]